MWKKFTQALGEFVQRLFKKNTSKRGLRRETGILEDSHFMKTDAPAQLSGDLEWHCITIPTDTSFDLDCYQVNLDDLENELKKMSSTAYQVLPKHYWAKTLLVSTIGSWEYDSIGVDISQLEETGIAHFFCTSTQSQQESIDRWCAAQGKAPWEAENEWQTIIIHDAVLLEYPDGTWTWVDV